MYIFELLSKYFQKNKESVSIADNYYEQSEIEKCEHIFLPIDSTKKTLACNKCGLVIKVKDNENIKRNFFH